MVKRRPQQALGRCTRIALASLVLVFLGTGVADADPCADELTSFQPGADGGWVDPRLSLPDVVLGVPRGGSEFTQSLDVLSLGTGGSLTLGFVDNVIVDRPGDDFRVFENAFRNSPTRIFREAAYVEASRDGVTFYRFPVVYTDGAPATPADLLADPTFESTGLLGLAGLTPGFSHPDNGIDPRSLEAGGDGFDLATIGLDEARYIRIVDAADTINDEGNHFPIVGHGKAGADIDTVIAVHSRQTCGRCCDAVFDGKLKAQDLMVLQRVARGLPAENICGPMPCSASQCGDMDDDNDLDTADVWLCLERALGDDVPCPAGDCDLPLESPASHATTQNAKMALEIPARGSIQSGIGIVSGWKCSAGKLTASFDDGELLEVAYGTPRGDTESVCGDRNNAFVMLWNYSNLSDGEHTLRLFDDGVEFASTTFRTQTLGRRFLGASDTPGQLEFSLANFPDPNQPEGVRIGWQTASQSFGILNLQEDPARQPDSITNLATASSAAAIAPGSLEIPAAGSTISGISLVSGWRCDAGEITASFNQGDPVPVAYGTSRRDTLSICGDANNAYAMQWNFGLLGDGLHTLELRDDGEVFATRTFYVSSLGTPFYRGAQGSYELNDFPKPGDAVTVEWSEASQSFQTIDYQPGGLPTPTPTPAPTPASTSCEGALDVRLSLLADGPGAAVLRLSYPESVTLPETQGAIDSWARIETMIDPLPEILSFHHRGDHLAIGMVDTDGIPQGAVATIRFDCNGSRPSAGDFQCEVDASDRNGNTIDASCTLAVD